MQIKVEDHSAEFLRLLAQASEAGLEAIGNQAVSHAKQNLNRAPKRIDTGLLRNSITYAIAGKGAAQHIYKADKRKKDSKGKRTGPMPPPKIYSGVAPSSGPDDKTVYIGSNTSYAVYVHEGTSKMAPNRFLKNAIEGHGNEYKQILENYLRNG